MGCDIHGNWQLKNNEGDWETVEELECWRNYILFSILANVRNKGFITPISEPRGLPRDVFCTCEPYEGYMGFGSYCQCTKISDSYMREHAYGDHSYSWLLASEIKDYFNTHTTIQETGVVDREDFDNPNKDPATPYNSYCGSISGPDIVVGKDIDGIVFPSYSTHVETAWTEDLKPNIANFEKHLDEIVSKYGDQVRLVFGFDN